MPLVQIQGQIERITYVNQESNYTIAKVHVPGKRDLVTVLGAFPSLSPGEVVKLLGEWGTHPKFGEQFKVVKYETVTPATARGIEKYLGSGLIKGIGPVTAKRIVARFGIETLDVIETDVGKLTEVSGIGTGRVDMIRKAWIDQKEIRGVMVFLQDHDVSTTYAAKIYKRYGNEAVDVVKNNPYRLAQDIFGIGFLTADRIAQKIGIPKDSSQRAEAGVLHVLRECSDEGHVFYPYEPLVRECSETLGVERDIVVRGVAALTSEKKIIVEDLNTDMEDFRENNKAVYLARFHVCETGIAARIRSLTRSSQKATPADSTALLRWVQDRLHIHLAEKQAEAIRAAIEEKAVVVTGGPGTGKTTIVKSITHIFARMGKSVMLAAPTGRAAKRLAEATGREAKTIHRLLEFQPSRGAFKKDEHDPLATDVLVIDEASMIDTVLMYQLLKAVPAHATLILVGDIHQLPSVGPGNVLKDVISSGTIRVVELSEIFRQAKESFIVVNAHRINNGQMPLIPDVLPGRLSDFYFIREEDPERALADILELVKTRIPRRFGLDPLSDVQILTPMHKGLLGATSLNAKLQEELNHSRKEVSRGGRTFKLHDKVMQIRNNYDKNVFNGDIGQITAVDLEDQEVTITFDGRPVNYDLSELDEIVLAYAVSVHKAQGSEYPAIILPVMTQHYILLQRNLLYTAVTRAKKLAILIGTHKALAIAVNNDRVQKRYTGLAERLRNAA